MEFLNMFTEKHIYDVVMKTFPHSSDTKISFSSNKCNSNEKFTLLNVKGEAVEQIYVLVKVSKNSTSEENLQFENAKVSYPVFIIENTDNESYGAFRCQDGLERFILPEHNNIECLKIILQNLAEYQAANLTNSEEITKSNEFKLKYITDSITTLDFFKDLDTAIVENSVKNLQIAVNKLLENSTLLVNSIWCPSANNVYLSPDMRSARFLVLPSTRKLPPVYDALLYVFSFSNEKFRQQHFENLIHYYFESLTKSLQKLQNILADRITTSYSEHQVKVWLPVAKFIIASFLFKLENSVQLPEIMTNILFFLKHPLINQEDIYETTRNKIRTNDFDLLDYNLVPLSVKNGHLGEYFHLNIKIKNQNREETLHLFAKFLITSTEFMEKVLRNGPSLKEHYFYETLLPLYAKHGLGNLLNFAPKCYLNRFDWLLILDDLIHEGYVGYKPNTVLNYEGLKVMVEKFANLHSCTIILEEILSEESAKTVRLDEDYGDILNNTILKYGQDDNPLKEFNDSALKMLYYIVEKCPNVTEKLKDASSQEIRIRLKKLFVSFFSKISKSDKIRNVINHGDVFIANMLFKFGDHNAIANGILVDFQMLQYVSPNYDLLVFLFYTSTKETRDKYLRKLIDEYYQHVSENIRRFNFDPEIVFPKKSFYDDVDFMMSAGVMGAFMYSYVLHIDADFREEIAHNDEKFDYYFNKHSDELVDLSWETEHYRTVLTGLVEDIVNIIRNEI